MSDPTINEGRRYRSANRDGDNDVMRHDWEDSASPGLFEIVRYNTMSQHDAEHVWMLALEDWDMDSSTEEERKTLMRYLTTCFCISTSKDDENLSTRFRLPNGKEISLNVLAVRAAETSISGNDSRLRVFVRSFRNGLFVRAQHTMLADPANAELRTKVVLPLGVDPAYAAYCFDTADFLPDANVRLSTEEMVMVTRFKAIRTSLATMSAYAVGEMTGRNDNTSVNSKVGARTRTSNTLANFAPVLPDATSRMNAANINLR